MLDTKHLVHSEKYISVGSISIPILPMKSGSFEFFRGFSMAQLVKILGGDNGSYFVGLKESDRLQGPLTGWQHIGCIM